MNILFIYDSPLRPKSGGTERATKLVMDELSRHGHITIGLVHAKRTAPNNWYYNGKEISSLSEFLNINDIHIVVNQIAFNYWLLESFLYNGGKIWRERGGRIISFMHLDPTPAPRKKIRRYFDDWKNKSFIGKIKRLGLILYLPILNRIMDKEYSYSMKYLYENSDRYILMSPSFAPVFSKLCGKDTSAKTRFITNMLTFPNIENKDIVEKKEKMILVVARMDDEQKNISFILDAWRNLRCHHGYKLHIVGGGMDETMLKLKARDMGDVIFEGAQDPLPWYRRAEIFLMASPREGWGLTITESLQCGVVPVVLNTSPVFMDIIDNGENGFMPNDMEEYIRDIEMLMTKKDLRITMAKNGLDSALRFTPGTVGLDWENVLKELYPQ